MCKSVGRPNAVISRTESCSVLSSHQSALNLEDINMRTANRACMVKLNFSVEGFQHCDSDSRDTSSFGSDSVDHWTTPITTRHPARPILW
jgi:hypothetical protein